MRCHNCGKQVLVPKTETGAPYCGCRFYDKSRRLSYFILGVTAMKIAVRQPLWVIANHGEVGLLGNGAEILLRREEGGISVTFNGERLGVAGFITLPPFVEKLLSPLNSLCGISSNAT